MTFSDSLHCNHPVEHIILFMFRHIVFSVTFFCIPSFCSQEVMFFECVFHDK